MAMRSGAAAVRLRCPAGAQHMHAARRGAAVHAQVRFRSLRDAIHSKQLAEGQLGQDAAPKAGDLDAELKNLNADLRSAHHEYDLKATGYADVDQRAREAEEVVAAMSEEEIRENQEIIKRMMIRGARAFGIAMLGIAIAVYIYRKKRLEMAEKKRLAAGEEVDVSVTLREFERTVNEAMEEQRNATAEEPADATPPAWYTVKYWKKKPEEEPAPLVLADSDAAATETTPAEAAPPAASFDKMKLGASVATAVVVLEVLRLYCIPSRK